MFFCHVIDDYIHILLGVETFAQAFFGQGGGRIWLSNVECTGSERALVDCTASTIGVNTCTHAQDAGVRCRYGRFVTNYI